MNKTVKYTIAALAVMMIGASAFAQSGAVYSLNVVGFQKVTAPNATYTMVGMPFDGDENSVELNELVGAQLTAGANYASSDKILMWDSVGQAYVRYYLRNNARAGVVNKWVLSTDEDVATTNAFVYPENGFWINPVAASPQTIVLVGDVVNDEALTNTIESGLNLISYPFSTPIKINEMNLTNGTAGANYASSDKIMAWDEQSSQYIRYYFRNNARAGVVNKWVLSTDEDTISTNVIPPEQGFWYKRDTLSSFEWVAPRPYTLD